MLRHPTKWSKLKMSVNNLAGGPRGPRGPYLLGGNFFTNCEKNELNHFVENMYLVVL